MESATRRVYAERILKVLLFIQEHLDEELSLGELARLAHFSPCHFHRIFRGMVGEGLHEHVRRLRLERAALRLRSGCDSILNLALDAGYETHEAFTRAFRAMFGQPPSAYREAHAVQRLTAPARVHYSAAPGVIQFEPATTGGPPMQATIKNVQPLRVAFVRHIGPYSGCKAAWDRLCAWAGPRGLFGPGTQFVGICHDDPEVTPPDKIRYDACMTVGPTVQGEGDVGIQEVKAGEYAVTEHRGPYEKLSETYARLCGEWIPAQGREIRSAPSFEVYKNDPGRTRPADLRTDVHVPLEPR